MELSKMTQKKNFYSNIYSSMQFPSFPFVQVWKTLRNYLSEIMTCFTPSGGIFLRVSYFVFALLHIYTMEMSPVFSLPFVNGDSYSSILCLLRDSHDDFNSNLCIVQTREFSHVKFLWSTMDWKFTTTSLNFSPA